MRWNFWAKLIENRGKMASVPELRGPPPSVKRKLREIGRMFPRIWWIWSLLCHRLSAECIFHSISHLRCNCWSGAWSISFQSPDPDTSSWPPAPTCWPSASEWSGSCTTSTRIRSEKMGASLRLRQSDPSSGAATSTCRFHWGETWRACPAQCPWFSSRLTDRCWPSFQCLCLTLNFSLLP